MGKFKMLVTTINFGELVNTICKIVKFGFAKSADLFSSLELLNKMSCNKTFRSVNKICRHIKHLVKIRKKYKRYCTRRPTCVYVHIQAQVAECFFSPPNGRYIDCSSSTYATNKSKTLKLQYRY